MQTIDEMIAVLQAAKEGKTIQYRCSGQDWKDRDSPYNDWHFGFFEYRVRPQPRDFWVPVWIVSTTKDIAKAMAKGGEVIPVREILD